MANNERVLKFKIVDFCNAAKKHEEKFEGAGAPTYVELNPKREVSNFERCIVGESSNPQSDLTAEILTDLYVHKSPMADIQVSCEGCEFKEGGFSKTVKRKIK